MCGAVSMQQHGVHSLYTKLVQNIHIIQSYNSKTKNWQKLVLHIDGLKAQILLKSVDCGRLFQILWRDLKRNDFWTGAVIITGQFVTEIAKTGLQLSDGDSSTNKQMCITARQAGQLLTAWCRDIDSWLHSSLQAECYHSPQATARYVTLHYKQGITPRAARRYEPPPPAVAVRWWHFISPPIRPSASVHGSKNRGRYTCVRGQVHSPHISGGQWWLSCRQSGCL